MRCRRNDRGARPGAAAAELALLVLPVLVPLLLVTVDFTRLLYGYITLATCAENGALYACDPTSQWQSPYASVTAAAQADASGLSGTVTVDVKYSTSLTDASFTSATAVYDSSGTGYVRVTVTWTVPTSFSYPGAPTQLARSVKMRMLS
jgi:Flp pilus assembly protein TadG